jgi:hypothetical protein
MEGTLSTPLPGSELALADITVDQLESQPSGPEGKLVELVLHTPSGADFKMTVADSTSIADVKRDAAEQAGVISADMVLYHNDGSEEPINSYSLVSSLRAEDGDAGGVLHFFMLVDAEFSKKTRTGQ